MSEARGVGDADDGSEDSRVPAGVGGSGDAAESSGAAAPSRSGRGSSGGGRGGGQGLFARIARRWRQTVAELRKVVWPTRKQLVTYTIVVLVFVSFFLAYAAGLDFVFTKFMFWAFG